MTKKNKNRISFYETTDFSAYMRKTKGTPIAPVLKRITINISDRIYNEAKELDGYMHMGYQNVLKAAMTLGLTELYGKVSSRKLIMK